MTILSVLAAATAAAMLTHSPATLVKGQDLDKWDSAGYTAQGMLAAGATTGEFRWITCGVINGVPTGQSDHTDCSQWGRKAVPVLEDERVLARVAATGALGGRTVLLDLESWPYTPPAQWQNPGLYTGRAAALAHRYGFRLIVTLGGKLAHQFPALATAARDNVYAIAVQAQGQDGMRWARFISKATAAIHAARESVLVIAGVATNTPDIHTVRQLLTDWKRHLAAAYWINSDNHMQTNLCNASQGGYGCPLIAVRFLNRILP